jgi:hypothetical protein
MSLLSDSMENCIVMDKRTAPDGRGGFTTSYIEGAPFEAAITIKDSTMTKIAEKMGVTNKYSVITFKNTNLQPLTVFKRVRDGKTFRVMSDGDDNVSPKSASIEMRIVSAEQYVMGAENG